MFLPCSRNGGPSDRRPSTPEPGDGHGPLVDGIPVAASHPRRSPGPARTSWPRWWDLRIRLDERRKAEQLAEIDRRGRAAFLSGAEERSTTVEGRPLTADELKRVTKRYPSGD